MRVCWKVHRVKKISVWIGRLKVMQVCTRIQQLADQLVCLLRFIFSSAYELFSQPSSIMTQIGWLLQYILRVYRHLIKSIEYHLVIRKDDCYEYPLLKERVWNSRWHYLCNIMAVNENIWLKSHTHNDRFYSPSNFINYCQPVSGPGTFSECRFGNSCVDVWESPLWDVCLYICLLYGSFLGMHILGAAGSIMCSYVRAGSPTSTYTPS